MSDLFENDKKNENDLDELLNKNKKSQILNWFSLSLGTLSVVIGVFVSSAQNIFDKKVEVDNNFIIAVVSSVLGVLILYLFIKFKDNQESSGVAIEKNPLEDSTNFEKEVIASLKKIGLSFNFIDEGRDRGYDLEVKLKNYKIAIEIKAWRIRPPLHYLSETINRLQNAIRNKEIKEGIIVIRDQIDSSDMVFDIENIKIMTISELKRYLSK